MYGLFISAEKWERGVEQSSLLGATILVGGEEHRCCAGCFRKLSLFRELCRYAESFGFWTSWRVFVFLLCFGGVRASLLTHTRSFFYRRIWKLETGRNSPVDGVFYCYCLVKMCISLVFGVVIPKFSLAGGARFVWAPGIVLLANNECRSWRYLVFSLECFLRER